MKVTSNSSMRCSEDDIVWPPGFRFHPTDEELVLYYLKRKICRRRLKLDIIGETDVYKWDPEDLPGLSILKTGDRQWFFFSPRDRKYPNGARSNRATQHGYWKATGKDRNIMCNSRTVGVKKTLVFYKGRAPNGERTDWVMHEYTLDEDELKRCQTAGDYYALYKVFKKSGPGPKNGEQYGAPFKEEDWTDDEIPEVHNNIVDQENPVKKINDVSSVLNFRANGQVQSPLNGVEKIMNPIADESALDQQRTVGYTCTVPQIVGEEESVSAMVDPSVSEAIFTERSMVLHPSSEQGVEASFDFTQSATTQLQLHEPPEVTSVPNIYEQDPHISEEDFLEIDDLIGPEPTISKVNQPVQNLQFEEIDGLSELDLYHDAAMFLRDLGPIDQGVVSDPYLNTLENEMVNHLGYQLQSHLDGAAQGVVSDPYTNTLENEMVNHLGYQLQSYLDGAEQEVVSDPCMNTLENEMVNHLGYQLQSHLDGADQISNQLWTHDQNSYIFTSQESFQEAISLPTPGVVCTGSSTNIPTGTTQNQSSKEGGDAQSWFTSTLWGFVESIPTTPASASENMNRAFERMSSFGRVRINAINTNVAAGNGAATVRRAGRNSRFFFLSIIGVVCALLWVLMIGTSMRDLGRYISL